MAERIGTASQTVGPFFHIGLRPLFTDNLVRAGVEGQSIVLRGRVIDGDGAGVPDALVEIWQADARGEYASEARPRGFAGFGRVATDPNGGFQFTTIEPGYVAAPDGARQARHIAVAVFMRGQLRQLTTRVYFPGDAGHADDPLLTLVEPSRRGTLMARAVAPHTYEWNVILQGDAETVFFEFP